jgi:hypothetical protein
MQRRLPISNFKQQLDRTELIVIISPKVVWDRSDAREATDEVRSKMKSIYGRR